ncbi:EAL domain-containing protein [Mycobacterium sp. DL592]|uniref:EAL domain-containing protein n=1 Tax=Mycobacterium sp. DL592 TaxID=2675524 RepID=UPI00141EE428|nr:EAL domain-containing protein [Mycobacterium sp. DL592]
MQPQKDCGADDAIRDAFYEKPTVVFQPIVCLQDRSLSGYEALVRWPQLGNPSPEQVFDDAASQGEVTGLDQRCLETIVGSPRLEGLADILLFVNTVPSSDIVFDVIESSIRDLRRANIDVVFEITERGLPVSPTTLIKKVQRIRDIGCRIALDDLGANSLSLPMLDLFTPDFVKLDATLVRGRLTVQQSATISAVVAYRERTGATVIAEGIETVADLGRALRYGAGLGQGFLFGQPTDTPRLQYP